MSARAAVAAGLAGYLVGRFVGQARAWLDVLADLPDLPTDDDPVLVLPWQRAAPKLDVDAIFGPRTAPEACDRCVPGRDGKPVDVAPPFADLCEHVRAAQLPLTWGGLT